MVISGSPEQREKLIEFLSSLRRKKKIAFGIHVSQTSLVTCLVEDYETEHIHFLDVSNGGYTFAAIQMKEQLAKFNSGD